MNFSRNIRYYNFHTSSSLFFIYLPPIYPYSYSRFTNTLDLKSNLYYLYTFSYCVPQHMPVVRTHTFHVRQIPFHHILHKHIYVCRMCSKCVSSVYCPRLLSQTLAPVDPCFRYPCLTERSEGWMP